MSNTTTNESGNQSAAPAKKSRLLLIIVLMLALAGATGGGWYFYSHSKAAAAGTKPGKAKKAHADEEQAEEDGQDADEEPGVKKASSRAAAFSLPDDSKVKEVVELQPYVINLADKDQARYLRLTVSVGIGSEESTEKPGPLFTTRVRNAMLALLTTKTSEEVLTVEGKVKLRKELLRVARAASEAPKAQAIYITEFIVQL
jgi:flagellar FliL protein